MKCTVFMCMLALCVLLTTPSVEGRKGRRGGPRGQRGGGGEGRGGFARIVQDGMAQVAADLRGDAIEKCRPAINCTENPGICTQGVCHQLPRFCPTTDTYCSCTNAEQCADGYGCFSPNDQFEHGYCVKNLTLCESITITTENETEFCTFDPNCKRGQAAMSFGSGLRGLIGRHIRNRNNRRTDTSAQTPAQSPDEAPSDRLVRVQVPNNPRPVPYIYQPSPPGK